MTEEFGIGKTFKNGSPGLRDAVHAAVVQVSSESIVYPGDSLVFVDGTNYSKVNPIRDPGPQEDYECDEEGERIEEKLFRQAVADPFISTGSIPRGTYFWAFLTPNSTQGLRHVFEIIENKEEFADPFEPRANAQDSCRGCY